MMTEFGSNLQLKHNKNLPMSQIFLPSLEGSSYKESLIVTAIVQLYKRNTKLKKLIIYHTCQ